MKKLKLTKKGQWLEINVPGDWENQSIEEILKSAYQTPKALLHQLRMSKGVHLNGEQVQWSTKLSKKDKLQIQLFIAEDYGVEPQFIEIDILYEDDHVLIVNKPAGMDTHPTKEGELDTLSNAVAFHLQMNGIHTKIRHIHRLDHDTTGAVIFAKDRLSAAIMDRLLLNREITRTYLAIVHGIVKQKSGKIDAPIGRDRHHPTRRRISPSGQSAISQYKVLTTDRNQDTSLVELQLQTGRTHQIRVHMSHLGHPLVGDVLYGGKPLFNRQALHARKISLNHPLTNEKIECTAPFLDLPPIFNLK